MKKNKILAFITVFLIALTCFGGGMLLGAATSEPGSVGDPLVSKSYLDERLSEISGVEYGTGGGGYVKLSLQKGQKIILGEGATVVIRQGNALVFGENGLLNLTTGDIFKDGNTGVMYNLYMDLQGGNGLEARGNLDLFVSGAYTAR